MTTTPGQMRNTVVWALPFAALILIILWQIEWGRAIRREPPPETGAAPQPIALAILPEYAPMAPSDALRDAVERTLFNPTRRPAPTALAEAAKPKMQRGQFTLAGTLVVDGKAIALLRETAGGKSRRVTQGESVNGMTVAEVRNDRVKLTLGDESEELPLKIAAGPKTTIQPVVAGPAGGPVSATATVPVAAPGQAVQQAPRDVSEVLAERRRAARAAELAAQGLPAGSPSPQATGAAGAQPAGNSQPPPPAVTINPNDPQWASVYQRYQQPRR